MGIKGPIKDLRSGFYNRVDWLVAASSSAGLLAALAAQAGRVSQKLDVLADFAPIWLLAGALATLYGAGRGRRGLFILGLLGIVASADLIAPEIVRPVRPAVASSAPNQIKLIQYNAWEGNSRTDADAEWLARQKPDFILVEDAEPPITQALVRRGFLLTKGVADVAIFSRAPRLKHPFPIPKDQWPLLPVFARGTFEAADGKPFSLIAVHLRRPTDRLPLSAAFTLGRLVDNYEKSRLILAGDFNLAPWSFSLRQIDRRYGLERRDRALFSWPARLPFSWPAPWPVPFMPIDHVLAGSAWRTVSITCGPRLGSDHYPVIVILALEN